MYVKSLFNYERRRACTVRVGQVELGGDAPIRVQSMANTDTNDVEQSVAQAERIAAAGGELVRFTTQGVREAQSLGNIHQVLREAGYRVPLVADVHFNPHVAEVAAALVEKVRINPGNFVAGKQGDYSADDEAAELDKIRLKLRPLLDVCKQHHTALRIGVNHGSLSPRIMNKYGDTPEGLAASCMEFLRLCEAEHFHDIVLSVKASNTLVMVQAVRLLVDQMTQAGMRYPLHLGVTEAGAGEDGRIKSAVGIGALLADGIGDTVRVSLSEAPECEIPVARKLVDYIACRAKHEPIDGQVAPDFNPFVYARRQTCSVAGVGGDAALVVVATQSGTFGSLQPDFVLGVNAPDMCRLTYGELTDEMLLNLKSNPKLVLLHSAHTNPIGEMRAFFHRLMMADCRVPVIIEREYAESDIEDLQIKAAADFGALLLDGFGDGILLRNFNEQISVEAVNSLAFGILQAARRRVSRTEYISCPGCGRTMFDLQKTVADIKAATAHLTNLKIAVMGCIVNGPGEMADADYGYVGAGRGRVSLYRRKTCVDKNIPADEAVERLLALIESDRQ
ncbi:MAG: (E)-4-hydroxy-3-methylbut-2-enyl-diphosphate synthase [Paludibacteraceae bacterium]